MPGTRRCPIQTNRTWARWRRDTLSRRSDPAVTGGASSDTTAENWGAELRGRTVIREM